MKRMCHVLNRAVYKSSGVRLSWCSGNAKRSPTACMGCAAFCPCPVPMPTPGLAHATGSSVCAVLCCAVLC
jgi:hypothetical protein